MCSSYWPTLLSSPASTLDVHSDIQAAHDSSDSVLINYWTIPLNQYSLTVVVNFPQRNRSFVFPPWRWWRPPDGFITHKRRHIPKRKQSKKATNVCQVKTDWAEWFLSEDYVTWEKTSACCLRRLHLFSCSYTIISTMLITLYVSIKMLSNKISNYVVQESLGGTSNERTKNMMMYNVMYNMINVRKLCLGVLLSKSEFDKDRIPGRKMDSDIQGGNGKGNTCRWTKSTNVQPVSLL